MKKSASDTRLRTGATDVGQRDGLRPDIDGAGGVAGPSETLRLLHVEDNSADALLMQEYIRDLLPDVAFDTAARLSEVTTERVEAADCALLDLSLPDASGLEVLVAVRKMSESLPIIVLTGLDDMELGLTAVRDGADDYLLKNHVDAYTLERAVQYAVERRGLILQVAKATAETMVASILTAEAATSQGHGLIDDSAGGAPPTATTHAQPDAHAAKVNGTPTPRDAVVSAQSLHTSELLTPADVSTMLSVDPKTVSRWASDGRIASLRTPGGHRRFFKAEILALMPVPHQSDSRPALRPTDPVPAPPPNSHNRARGSRPDGNDGQRGDNSGNGAAAAGVDAAVNTAREFEADAVARAVAIAAETLVRAAHDAAVAARTAR